VAKKSAGSPTPEPSPAAPVGTDEPVQGGPEPAGPPQQTYVGTYLTREEAERGLQEKEEHIAKLTSERDIGANRITGLQRIVDQYMTSPGPGVPVVPGYAPTYGAQVTPGVGYPSAPGHPAAVAPVMPEITLRDPIDDPKGFREDMGKLLNTLATTVSAHTTQQIMGQVNSAASERQRGALLWQYFQTVHPDLAKHGEEVMESFNRIYGGRIPPNVTDMVEVLARDVRARVTAPAPGTPQPTASAPPDGRTGGIPGGTGPAPAPASPAGRGPSMTTQLREMQKKGGFF